MHHIRRFAAIAFLLPLSLHAQGGQVVGPGGTPQLGNPTAWIPSVTPNASIQVTTNGPRLGFGNVGTGSLEMSVTGVRDPVTGQYPDWGFWYRYAGGNPDPETCLNGECQLGDYAANAINSGASFGKLQSLTTLSFDWYRSFMPGWDAPVGTVDGNLNAPIPPADWAYKTPVMRLQLREQRDGFADVISELVWEGYYNQCSLGPDPICANNKTPVDSFVVQTGMQNDAFWYVRPPVVGGSSTYSSGGTCNNQMSFWEGGVSSQNQVNLFSAATDVSSAGCLFGANVDVIGVAVGVGSQWPLPYHGFVDNVRLGFSGQEGLALDANFDDLDPTARTTSTTTPEPSTWALMAAGLAGLGLAARRRRKKA